MVSHNHVIAERRGGAVAISEKNHLIVMRSRKRARQGKEVAELLRIVKQSMKRWEQ